MPSGVAVLLVVVGLVLMVLVFLFLRFKPESRVAPRASRAFFRGFPGTAQHPEALLLIQPGGRVEYISALARAFFDLREYEPYDLERLTRRVHPADDFLDLCARPGQKRVSIAGKLYEASSSQIPGDMPAMLLSLRVKEFSTLLDDGGASSEILRVVTDFSQSIAANLELGETVRAILDNINRLVPADVLELKLWDAERQVFFLPQAASLPTTTQFGKLCETLTQKQTPVLIKDTRNDPSLPENGELLAVQSYLGAPLLAGGQLVGVVEAGQIASAPFNEQHVELMRLISGQAAVAARNAWLYDAEEKRAAELAGLAKLNQMLGSAQETQHLYERLVESVTPLFETDLVGFLLYDEAKHRLEGKKPFKGLPDHLVDMYRVPIAPEGAAEGIINSQQPIFAINAFEDEQWRALGLSDIALAASLRDNALMPLVSSGRMLGYLQVGHHQRGAASFTADETRLMNIVASQAAAIIENVLLLQQSRARAARADALHRLASLTNSALPLDEIFKYSVPQLARLLQADMGAIFLIDEARRELSLRRESAFGVPEGDHSVLSQIFMDDPGFAYTVSGSGKHFTSGKISADRRILPLYRPLVNALQIESAIVAPLIVRNRSIGELMIGSYKTDYFDNLDLQTALSAASYLAAAVESANLILQTDESLRLHAERLAFIARVSRELSASLEVRQLLRVIHNEASRATQAECGSVVTFESSQANALAIHSAAGCQSGRALTPLEETILNNGEAQVIGDYSQEGIFPPHDGVRSAILAPILYQGRKMGLITLHSSHPNFFPPESVELATAIALQSGVALYNAQRYEAQKANAESARRRSDMLAQIAEVSQAVNEEAPLDSALQAIAEGIRSATPFRVALISVLESETGMLRRIAATGIPQDTLNELLARKQPLSSVQQLMKPEFKVSRSYLILADQFPVIPSDVHVVTLDNDSRPAQTSEMWNPKDALLIPLENARGEIVGMVSLDDPEDGLRPRKEMIEALEVFAAQASFFVAAYQKKTALQASIESLTIGLQRQQNMLNITQNDLPILLRKDLEQTISLHNLDRRAQRVRAGLAITESVSRQLDASAALSALGRETLTQLEMSVALVAENTPDGPRLLHVLGGLPRSTNVESLFGQRNPLRACLQNGKPILISNLDENEEWRDSSLLTALRSKAVICLPVMAEGKVGAAMLAVNPEPVPDLNEEDRQVYLQISQQTSIILQNISLLNQTRRRLEEVNLLLDFSRSLTGLEPDQMARSLLESARHVLHNAHAGVVFLWNPQTDTLMPRAASGYADIDSIMRIQYHIGEALPGMVFNQRALRRMDEVNFARDYNIPPENLALYRQGTGGRLPVSCLVVPIAAGDRVLGVIVLDSFNSASVFRAEDEVLMTSLTQQVALSLDNLRLVNDAQERAGLLQALNQSSTSVTSSLHSKQLVDALLDYLLPVIPYDTATLWMRDKDRLTVSAARGFADSDHRLGLSVSVSDSALFKEMAQTGQPILIHDVREDHRFPPVEAPRLSWLGIPLISKGELLGVIAVEKTPARYYTAEQKQISLTFASQAAVSWDNARLLEDSMGRAAELTQRTQRLATLNRLASALTSVLDTDQILALTAAELMQGLGADRVSVVVFERGAAQWKSTVPRGRASLPHALPDAPIFHRLRESLGIFNTDNPLQEPDLEPLQDMLGEQIQNLLILPLATGGSLAALMFVQNNDASLRYGANELEVARTITSQSIVGLENARLYQSTLRTAKRFAVLNEASSQISSGFDPEQVYEAVYQAAMRLMPVESFIIALLDEEKSEVNPVYLIDRGKRYPGDPIPLGAGLSSQIIQSGKPLLVSNSEELAGVVETVQAGEEGDETESIVAVPMMVAGGKALGMLSAQSYQKGVYLEEDLQILGTLANQAIVALENGKLFAETQKLTAHLEARVAERTVQLRHEQQSTETLLHILTEVSSSLDLDRALNRTLSLLNSAIGAEQGTIMLLHVDDNLLHYRAGYGYLTNKTEANTRGFTLKVGEGLAGWVVQNREAVLITDLQNDPRWVRGASGQGHRSAIVIPMIVVEDVIGVLMVFHRQEHFFSAEMLNLVKAIANQVAVAINNAHLYELIRDQAERLGVMLRKEQEDASRLQAVLRAVADGVLVTGADNTITFVNSTAEKILKIKSPQLLQKNLDEVADLLPRRASAWTNTIRRWADDLSLYEQGEYYAEKLEMEDNRTALVHLAPVILQNDFLGTVSIFRDITQEVEVDRLKSEFVATVSHELRTPMTSVKGYVDLLLMGATGALNENQQHFLDIVRNNIDRLNTLVDDLLDVSRIESGRVILEKKAIDLRSLAEEIMEETLLRSQRENKPLGISIDAPQALPPVLGDRERIRQILDNLVDNAYSYTPRNGSILINIHPEGDSVQVDIKDNGVGIPAADQDRIFQRFYRGEHPLVLATPGTGLGLPIVREMVNLHNGKIWMTSAGIPGEGSSFSFTLPISHENTSSGVSA